MKIFHANKKVNFVDINNVFVGYDTDIQCCERAGYFFADRITRKIPDEPTATETDGWVFDDQWKQSTSPSGDEGEIVIFRLTKGSKEKFLHLFNCHNGYYSHGFMLKCGDKVIWDDRI